MLPIIEIQINPRHRRFELIIHLGTSSASSPGKELPINIKQPINPITVHRQNVIESTMVNVTKSSIVNELNSLTRFPELELVKLS